MHQQIDSFYAVLFGTFGESFQQVTQDWLAEVHVLKFCLSNCIVPLEEELFVIVVDVGEVADAHPLQFFLYLTHLCLAVFIFALWSHFPEDI